MLTRLNQRLYAPQTAWSLPYSLALLEANPHGQLRPHDLAPLLGDKLRTIASPSKSPWALDATTCTTRATHPRRLSPIFRHIDLELPLSTPKDGLKPNCLQPETPVKANRMGRNSQRLAEVESVLPSNELTALLRPLTLLRHCHRPLICSGSFSSFCSGFLVS